MCGIVGIASQHSVPDRSILVIARDTMAHRGPDDAGQWWSNGGDVGFGHRRLAIIDLSAAGHQPMLDASGELCIVFNGEIYNFLDLRHELQEKGHSFRSKSDTEVMLAAYREWGVDFIARLNGMFSFVIYDARQHSLVMARDRAGEKPLFYSIRDGELRFASELKGLVADPAMERRIDADALEHYLTMGFVPGARCILQGVKKLPPAHAMVYDIRNASSRTWRYWTLPELEDSSTSGAVDENALEDELITLLEDAVRRQLVADVPIGVMLSGGVDSSLVTAMAVRSASNVKTFTIQFPGHEKYDETEHARIIARHFGTEHSELVATESTVDLLPLLARQLDEPMVDSAIIPSYLVSKIIREHCTVALGGDGGDELFGGYSHYNRWLWMNERLGWVPRALRNSVADGAEVLLPVGFKGRNWLQRLGADFNAGSFQVGSHFDKRTCQKLLHGHARTRAKEPTLSERTMLRNGDLLQRATRMDFENYLPEDILVKVDRASMLNSLEVRAPWLDYRIIEFAFRNVPSRLKATTTSRKILPKKLTGRFLPPEFDQTRKQGFSIPLASWLQSGPWKDFFHSVLLDSKDSIFDRKTVVSLLDGQAKGRANSERLFALVLFELWRKEYCV